MQTRGRLADRCQRLFDDALQRIPAQSLAWTDYNDTDPGIILVQLLAWLSESLLSRQIPERQRRIFQRISQSAPKRRCRRVLIVGGDKRARSAPARFLAGKLGLKLHAIDLSEVSDKYIGETEKNLGRIFEAAEDGRAILFFDEADALFGKRSSVQDSHDRYANQAVSYLLERLEHFQGIAILAISHKQDIDPAFLRRNEWVVYPGEEASSRVRLRKKRKTRGADEA